MAELRTTNTYRLACSTIAEVLVAMTVMLIVLSTAMAIYQNMMHSDLFVRNAAADALLNARMGQIQTAMLTGDATVEAGDFVIQQQIQPFANNVRLVSVHLTAFDRNHTKSAELFQVILTR